MINRRFKANRPKVIGSTDINPYWEVIKGIIRESDILLEVCDARMPELSRNEEIEKLAKSSKKQLVIILNKSDLVNFNQLMIHIKTLSKEFPVFALSGKSREGITRLRNYLFAKAKKVEKLRIGVLGYPNTGKSSVINAISRRGTAKVSSRAGTTRGQQWINAGDNMLIIDSPGVIPLRKEDELRYSLIASKNPEKIAELELVASEIIKLFGDKTPIQILYEIKLQSDNPEEIILEIGKKKGFLKKGGEVDENKTSIQIIRDWQNGRLRMN
ncbi:50S ribosome-binding GTPase [Candidatus Pacearchaeota archaeon]|nr:50S ribosome-binding GTPase [Candidatus Pacearchaeota archaeon]